MLAAPRLLSFFDLVFWIFIKTIATSIVSVLSNNLADENSDVAVEHCSNSIKTTKATPLKRHTCL